MNRHAIIDRSHMGRNFTGIERITEELFRKGSLGNVDIDYIESGGSKVLKLLTQMVVIPLVSLKDMNSTIIFPGFPPSPFVTNADRCILYIHDMFLIERWDELNATARFYMNPLLRLSLKRMTKFMVNSETTKANLQKYCRTDSKIVLYRPAVKNVFGLQSAGRKSGEARGDKVNVVAIGTVEPRKNYVFAARACQELERALSRKVVLHIVGRRGWGEDHETLTGYENVVLHGHVPDADVERLVDDADVYLCTSRDEGLGLPLLEIQYSGIPVAAPDKPVFREVLDRSGLFFDPEDPASAAKSMAGVLINRDRLCDYVDRSLANVERWNEIASRDKAGVIALLESGPRRA